MSAPVAPQETIPPGEAAEIKALIETLEATMTARDQPGRQRRDVHMKMHGVVRAEFTVPEGLAPELRVGLFARPATYKAWVRLSNGSNDPQPDTARDMRGMAIKLMGVPGRKALDDQADGTTHDFVLITTPNFMTHTAGQTDELMKALVGSLWGKVWYMLTHLSVAWVLLLNMRKCANVLQLRYFSAVPYAFGSLAVKYVATPRDNGVDAMPANPGPDFLREVLARQLAAGDVLYDFGVQIQRDEPCMPVEDPTRVWSLDLSPPRTVATLRILQQEFDTPAQKTFGDNLSFTPWRCLPEHRPLGAIGRARKVVYDTLSIFRHRINAAPRVEPVDWEI